MTNEKRIRELLKNAEKFDGLSFIKERIANREQLRKEKREKLKELITMKIDKTPTEMIEQWFIDDEIITKKNLMKAIEAIKPFELMAFRKIHYDGKNTILNNEPTDDRIKRLFPGIYQAKK